MEFCDISLLIIAGGKSLRMGQDKRWLSIDGMGMLERLCVKASRVDFAERFLCVDAVTEPMQDLAERYGFHILTDAQPGEGPMSGLSQGLAAAKTEYALAVAGDMPFFTFPPMRSLLEAAERHPEWEVVMPAAGGRHQPLAALYRKSFAVRAWEALQQGERRPRLVMARVPHGLVNFPDDARGFPHRLRTHGESPARSACHHGLGPRIEYGEDDVHRAADPDARHIRHPCRRGQGRLPRL